MNGIECGCSHEPTKAEEANFMTKTQILKHLRAANEVAKAGVEEGHHPFGAVLIAPDNNTVLLSQFNLDTVNHAESVLAREAAKRYSFDFLWNCTLVTTVEPCVMCSGTQYWANIGHLVYGMTEEELLKYTGNHPQNPTLSFPCRQVFSRGQKDIKVIGPVSGDDGGIQEEITTLHKHFWSTHPVD